MELPSPLPETNDNLINADSIHDTEFYLFDALKYHFYDFIKNVKELSRKDDSNGGVGCIENGWYILDTVKKVNEKIKTLQDEIKVINREIESRIVGEFSGGGGSGGSGGSGNEVDFSNRNREREPEHTVPYLNTDNSNTITPNSNVNWRRRGGGVGGRLISLSEDPTTNRVLNELLPVLMSFDFFGRNSNSNSNSNSNTGNNNPEPQRET